MQAAEYFAAEVARTEANAGPDLGEVFAPVEYYHCWSAAVCFAVMALEANIYDIMKSNERGDQSPLLGKVVPDVDREPTLMRYEIAWNLVSSRKFERGAGLVQPIASLIRLRDEITHAKTEFHDAGAVSKRLEKQLRYRFKLNPFKTGDAFFPDKCVSADSAHWATRTAAAFMREFAAETGFRLNVSWPA